MAIEAERLIINLEARLNKFDSDMRKAAGISDTNFRKIENNARRTQKSLDGFNFSGITRGLGALAAGAIGIQAIGDVARYAAQYRDLQNALKVTGLEGKALADVFGQLSQISIAQGAPLDALVTLYSRASQSSKDLKASQEDLIKFSSGIATALRVQGTSASEASGALLQLSQALSNGKVSAEEYNSLLDGGQAILKATAAGLTEAGGSVSKLTALVKSGQVSSEAFFRAFLAGQGVIEEMGSKTAPTVSQGFERINTAMINLVGELDKMTGASDNAAKNLTTVADVIQKMPAYIESAARGLGSLRKSLESFGSSDVFVKLNELLGVDGAAVSADFLKKRSEDISVGGVTVREGIPVPGSQYDQKAGDVPGANVTPGITEADKNSKDLARSAKTAAVSIKDLGVAAAEGAATPLDKEIEGATGGSISDYVDRVVKAESGGNANAKNPNSSATGLGQFIDSTWIALFKKNFPGIAAGKASQEILAYRTDANYSRKLIEAYAKENAAVLTKAGVAVNDASLQLSHFLGAGDAAKVLAAKPGTPLKGLISSASIAANPTILGGGRTVDDARAYGERRAGNTRRKAGDFTPDEEAANEALKERNELAKEQVQSYQDLIAGSTEFVAAQNLEATSVGLTAVQAAKLRYEQELLNQAAAAGLTLTPQQTAQISQLAEGMAQAEQAAISLTETQESLQEAQAEFQELAKDSVKGFVDDLIAGKSAGEALENVLKNIASRLLDMAIDGLFENLFSGGGKGGKKGGGGLGSILGSLFGFADGGYTGDGSKNAVAGVVHGGEYVMSKDAVERIGLQNLERLHQGFAKGGFVGMTPPTLRAGGSAASGPTQVRVINPPGVPLEAQSRRNPDGSLDIMLQKKVAEEIGTPGRPANRVLGASGLQKPLRRLG